MGQGGKVREHQTGLTGKSEFPAGADHVRRRKIVKSRQLGRSSPNQLLQPLDKCSERLKTNGRLEREIAATATHIRSRDGGEFDYYLTMMRCA
jgi:hypothetical protein